MDNLEKYIRDRRPAFDDQHPSDKVWSRINNELNREGKQFFLYRHMWKAAVIVLFAAVIWLLIDRQNQSEYIALHQIEVTEGIAFNQVEEYYFHMIDNKQQEIRQFISDNPEVDEQLLTDIAKLDSSYQVLRGKLLRGPDERILDAMVINLQTRIEILNQQLTILKRIKNLKDKKDETTDI